MGGHQRRVGTRCSISRGVYLVQYHRVWYQQLVISSDLPDRNAVHWVLLFQKQYYYRRLFCSRPENSLVGCWSEYIRNPVECHYVYGHSGHSLRHGLDAGDRILDDPGYSSYYYQVLSAFFQASQRYHGL